MIDEIWKPERKLKDFLILAVPRVQFIEDKKPSGAKISLAQNIYLSPHGIFFVKKEIASPENDKFICFEMESVKYILISKNEIVSAWFSIPKSIIRKFNAQ